MSDKQYPYGMGWVPQKPDSRDYKFSAAPEVVVTLPPVVDLRANDTPILNQGGLGSCTAFAGVGEFMFLQKKLTGAFVSGSPLYIYYATRHYIENTGGDVGATLRDTAKEMAKYGVPPESVWPYNESMFDSVPSSAATNAAVKAEATNYYLCDGGSPTDTINNIKAALATAALPVMFGSTVYESIFSTGPDGMMAGPGGSVAGGHAMDILGYSDPLSCFLIRNSWGTNWGSYGYAWMPFTYWSQGLASDCWVVAQESQINPGPNPTPTPVPTPTPNPHVAPASFTHGFHAVSAANKTATLVGTMFGADKKVIPNAQINIRRAAQHALPWTMVSQPVSNAQGNFSVTVPIVKGANYFFLVGIDGKNGYWTQDVIWV